MKIFDRGHPKQTCPRRMHEWGTWERVELLDYWRDDHTCSFCGSLEPDLLLLKLEAGEVELGPTDKSYKVYVEGMGSFAKFYFQHFNEAQQNKFIELMNIRPRPFKIGYPGRFYVMPFFVQAERRDHE